MNISPFWSLPQVTCFLQPIWQLDKADASHVVFLSGQQLGGQVHWRGRCALEYTLPIGASSWVWKCQHCRHLASHQSPKQELSKSQSPGLQSCLTVKGKDSWNFTAVRRAQCRFSWSKHKCLLCKWEEKQPSHLQESTSKSGSFNSQQQRLSIHLQSLVKPWTCYFLGEGN